MKRIVLSVLLILALLVCLCSCRKNVSEEFADDTETYTFTDDLSREVTVKSCERTAPPLGSFADVWVLSNKLSSPGITGVNVGAGIGVTICCAMGLLSGWTVSVAAFPGSLVAVSAVSACDFTPRMIFLPFEMPVGVVMSTLVGKNCASKREEAVVIWWRNCYCLGQL